MDDMVNDEDKKFERACRFVVKLGTMVHAYGPQTHRLESCLLRITEALGYSGFFSSTPTSIAFSFKKPDEFWHRTHVVSMPGTGFNLAKLAKAGELAAAVTEGRVGIEDATAALDEIDALPPPYGKIIVAAGYALCGAGFAGFLQGNWWDVMLSALLSIVVFFIVTMTEHSSERLAQWVPFLCSFLVGVLSAAACSRIPGTGAYLITLSAIIYLIPGFSISIGIIELTTKHITSGITNLMSGLLCLALLFAGAWAGITLAEMMLPVHSMQQNIHVSSHLAWISLMLLASGLCIVFQTPPRDFLWAMAGCAAAYAGILLGGSALGNNLGNFLGMTFATIGAHIWSDKTRRPASIVLIPSIVFMVSGSIGFRGLVALSAGNTALGLQEFSHMFVVAATLAIALILGSSILKPRMTL